ncbi:MAG: sensor histidine kinase [Planctomycetota bacterium]|nr:MAG: sensor histidine kinase [Planctomycetota bacterium]
MGTTSLLSTWCIALLVSLAYLILAVVYVRVSGAMVLAMSDDIEELARLETIKGTLFMLLTSLLIFVSLVLVLRRMQISQGELQRREERLLAAQARAVNGDIASACAHDIANLLAVTQGHLELAKLNPNEQTQYLQRALESHQRTVAVLDHLRRPLPQQRGALGEVLDHILELLRYHQALRHCQLSSEIPDDCRQLAVDVLSVQRFLLNAVINSAEASDHGKIHLRVRRLAERQVHIELHDDGPGIPKAMRSQILEPYFSTKERGSGLGMVAVAACARAHSGQVEIGTSPLLGGALVAVTLNTSALTVSATAPSAASPPA